MQKGEQMQEFYAKDGNVNYPLDRKSVSIPIMMETMANKNRTNDPNFVANFGGGDNFEELDKRSSEGKNQVEMQQRSKP